MWKMRLNGVGEKIFYLFNGFRGIMDGLNCDGERLVDGQNHIILQSVIEKRRGEGRKIDDKE
jgi:hypothetical protein